MLYFFIFFYSSFSFCQIDSIPQFQKHLNAGEKFYQNAEYKFSEIEFYKAYKIAEQQKNFEVMTIALNNIANIQSATGKIEQSIETYTRSLKIAKSVPIPRLVIRILSNIGILYEYQNDDKSALEYYNQALPIAVETSDSMALADLYNNIGVIEEKMRNYKKALALYELTLKIVEAKQIHDRVALVSNNIGLVYKNTGDYYQAQIYFQKSLDYSIQSGFEWCEAAVYNNIGNLKMITGSPAEAEKYLQKALVLAKRIEANEIVIEAYEGMATLKKKTGNFREALDYIEKHEALKDSLMGAERMAQILELKQKYEAEEQASKIRILEQQKALDDLALAQRQYELSRQNTFWTIGIFMLLVFGVIGWLLYNQRVIKEKAILNTALLKSESDRKEAIYNTEKAERIRIARDMHDELGSGLSKISVLSQSIEMSLGDNPTLTNDLRKLSQTSIELVKGMSDLVWSLNPENSTLEILLQRMREFAYDFLEVTALHFEAKFPDVVPHLVLSQGLQRNVYLCFKESLNNVVKHSKAINLKMNIEFAQNMLQILIDDDGKGFDINELNKRGNGLRNMKSRMEKVGGIFEITSAPGHGTKVLIQVKLNSDEN